MKAARAERVALPPPIANVATCVTPCGARRRARLVLLTKGQSCGTQLARRTCYNPHTRPLTRADAQGPRGPRAPDVHSPPARGGRPARTHSRLHSARVAAHRRRPNSPTTASGQPRPPTSRPQPAHAEVAACSTAPVGLADRLSVLPSALGRVDVGGPEAGRARLASRAVRRCPSGWSAATRPRRARRRGSSASRPTLISRRAPAACS